MLKLVNDILSTSNKQCACYATDMVLCAGPLFPYGFNAGDLPGPSGDDSSSDAILLDKSVVFYGREYKEIFVRDYKL